MMVQVFTMVPIIFVIVFIGAKVQKIMSRCVFYIPHIYNFNKSVNPLVEGSGNDVSSKLAKGIEY